MPRSPYLRRGLISIICLLTIAVAGCSSNASATHGGSSSPSTTKGSGPTATATPQAACTQLAPGSTPFQSLSGVTGVQFPAGTYISAASASGGGAGEYTVQTYTVCFQGQETAIDGGVLTQSATPSSTLGYLVHGGWLPNNLFPDPSNFAYLDACSSGHTCVNDPGSPNPFTFFGVDQFASHTGGYTTFRLQVASIAAPSCLNDPQYYSGTAKYTLYEDGNSASSSNPTYHFQMPPGTRVSTFQGGGTAGSTYVYFCSNGTQASVVGFLSQSMQNAGYSVTALTASGFNAALGSGPTYNITVLVQNTNNYYLRVFRPM